MCSYGCLDDLRNGVEVRDARRSAMAALLAAIVTVVAMLGWITWVAFVVGAIGGIFGIVANSLMLCCGDLNQRPGLCCDAGGQLAAHKLPCRLAASKALNMIAFVIHSSSVFYWIAALATNYFGGWYDEANDVFNTRRRSLLSTPDPNRHWAVPSGRVPLASRRSPRGAHGAQAGQGADGDPRPRQRRRRRDANGGRVGTFGDPDARRDGVGLG